MTEFNIGDVIIRDSEPPTMTGDESQQVFSQLEAELGKGNPMEEAVDSPESVPVENTDTFDPSIHCAMPDGSPRFNQDGSFRRRKKRKGEVVEDAKKRFDMPPDVSTVQVIAGMLDGLTLVAVKTLGTEWKLEEKERDTLADVYARYAAYKGWDKAATPEVAVIVITFSVFMPRIMNPNTWSKLRTLFSRRDKSNAHPNSWPNQNGQNHPRQDNGFTDRTKGDARSRFGPVNIKGVGEQNGGSNNGGGITPESYPSGELSFSG